MSGHNTNAERLRTTIDPVGDRDVRLDDDGTLGRHTRSVAMNALTIAAMAYALWASVDLVLGRPMPPLTRLLGLWGIALVLAIVLVVAARAIGPADGEPGQ